MASISSGIKVESNFMNLKAIEQKDIRPEVFTLLAEGESVVSAFKTVRDQVIFTDKRIYVVNVRGITGKKVAYFSYPYSKIQFFGIETAGLLDIDSELAAVFSNGTVLLFDFKSNVDIKGISQIIAQYII